MGKAMNARINARHGLPLTVQLINLFMLAFLLSLVGILSRPIGSLSLFWPVNAILLGLLLRKPIYGTPLGWLTTYLGMVAADLSTGEGWSLALWLNACNMSLIAVGYGIMLMLPQSQRRMGKPQAILYMFSASLAGAAVASTLSVLRNDSLYNNTVVVAWLAWFSEQFSTTLLLLPVLMAAPRLKQLLRMQVRWRLKGCLPLLALLLSLAFSVYIGGPGAIAFPIPALLWCAVRYPLFPVTLLTLLTGMTEISSISAMLVMGPLILASSIAANRKLMRRLEHSANHDFLTGVLARSAMTRKAGELLEHKHRSKEAVSLLLIDIDHFKQINDTHGHSAGDQVLASFAHIVRRELRHDQLFGRLGGEEFAIMLPRALAAQGVALGEHLRRLVEQTELQAEGKQTLKITISVGVASLAMNEVKSLEQLMNMADIALYRAKSQGRNRVESFNVINGNSVEHILFR